MSRNNLLDHRRMGGTFTPIPSQSCDLQASFPIKLTKGNSSDLCPVGSFGAWAEVGLVGPVREARGRRAECNRKTMGDGHWAHLRMSSDSTQRPSNPQPSDLCSGRILANQDVLAAPFQSQGKATQDIST